MSDTPATSELDRRPESKWSMVGKDPYAMPIDKIDLAHPGIWQENEFLPFLKRCAKRPLCIIALNRPQVLTGR